MRLSIVKSPNAKQYYVIKDYTNLRQSNRHKERNIVE